ncbi:F-box domain-containing protein [Phlyctema vagabunda]|uniref:F-box domain-containing protein n=1 Tax=Phlyctema vagabunda TaxID=108571 RepID=A0ABR4PKR1_9HELO
MASPMTLTTDEFRLLTWSRPGLNRMTIAPQSLRRLCPLDNGRLQPCTVFEAKETPASPSTIGDLDSLPLEIIHSTFNILDLQTLTDFRAISWRARALVDSFPPYSAIVRHSPDALRALLSTHMAVYFTAQDIFEALCTQACFSCGHFGPFLDMFTGHRHCIICVTYSDDLLSMTASSAKREFGLNPKTMRTLPALLSLPGQYTESEKTYRRRTQLVRMLSATAAASMQHEDSSAPYRRPEPSQLVPPPILHQFRERVDGHGQNPYRFMAMVRLPALDRSTENLEWGVSCQACCLGPRDERRGYYNWNTVYSAAEYVEHFKKCQVSQIGRTVVPGYIVPGSRDQRRSDARFLGFLYNIIF